jgi:hypothetical protein
MTEKELGEPDPTLTLFGTAVADVIARERNLAPMTDDPIFQALSAYLGGARAEREEPKRVEVGLVAAELLVPTPSTQAVGALPVSKLLEVRSKLSKQRRSFREKIQAQTTALGALPSEAALREHLQAFAKEIHGDLEEQREALQASKVKNIWSVVSVTVPASIAAAGVAAATAPIALPFQGIGTVALGVTSWYLKWRRGRSDKGHYMLSVEHALGSGKNHGALESGLNRLMHR